jgi:hypothetical protein
VNLDVSVAPEIAQLIEPRPRAHGSALTPGAPGTPAGPHRAGAARPTDGTDPGDAAVPTVGRLARELRLITAAPGRWWGLVQFDPARPVRIAIPSAPWYEAWLVIIPPSEPGRRPGDGAECGGQVVTVVAGEVAEQPRAAHSPTATSLLPGRVRVHGSGPPHQVVNLGCAYAVTMHARAR